ncbi:MAG: L-ribulose-5-phosphate 3-epimerase [Epulopiscium sp.]|nr:L-ribulose-5-phosphate 3-epimerase [Candidatus Epulonipiscium sp.]
MERILLKENKSTYRLGIYEKAMPAQLTWEEKFTAAKEAGYDFVEMSIDETEAKMARLNWSEKEIEEVLSAAKKVGIGVESFCFSAQRKHPLGSGLEGAEEKAMEILYQAVQLAMKMGVRIIQLQGYDCYYNETTSFSTKERFFRNLKKSVEYAAMYGVILAMETMENDFMNTIEKAMYYVEEIQSPYLQVYPDIGNISNATQYVCKDIRRGKGHIASAHLKETVPGKFREIPYGTGQVDFPSAIATLYHQGVRRFVAEFWYTGEENWKDILLYNRNFLEKQFELAFQL